MRTWERVQWLSRCGGCGAVLGVGMVMQLISFPEHKHQMVRCEQCADGKPPDAYREP